MIFSIQSGTLNRRSDSTVNVVYHVVTVVYRMIDGMVEFTSKGRGVTTSIPHRKGRVYFRQPCIVVIPLAGRNIFNQG